MNRQYQAALDKLKMEVAQELGVEFDPSYNGDKLSREMGSVGGGMVKRLVEIASESLSSRRHN